MALFNRNEELSRQFRGQQFSKATGLKKKALGAMGFKDTGELNTWGKVMSNIPVPGLSTLTNVAGRGLTKNLDTGDVIKSGTDEAISSDLGKLAFALNVGKAVGTGGMSEVMGIGKGQMGKESPEVINAPSTAGSDNLGLDTPSSSGSGILNMMKSESMKRGATDQLESEISDSQISAPVDNPMDPNSFKDYQSFEKYWNNQGAVIDSETGDITDAEGNLLNEGNKFSLKNLKNVGGIVGSGVDMVQKNLAYNKELQQEYNQMRRRKVVDTFSYL